VQYGEKTFHYLPQIPGPFEKNHLTQRRGGRGDKPEPEGRSKKSLTQSRKGREENHYVLILKQENLALLFELGDIGRNFLFILRRILNTGFPRPRE
jgi:hypothetical protein